jgi:hypothetical protein
LIDIKVSIFTGWGKKLTTHPHLVLFNIIFSLALQPSAGYGLLGYDVS